MTDNRKTELLPCPFCGGEAHISDDYSSKRGMVYSVWHDCPAGGGYHPYGQDVGVLQVTSAWFSSREEAIVAWNTRAELVSETCEVEWFDDGVDEGMDGEWFSYAPPTWYLSCGHTAQGTEKPNFCPVCGKAVKR